MSLSALKPPGAWGADIAVGECQPIGLPMNFGGPYAGYLATRKEHLRKMPGRIVGRTADARGREGFTLTLQTREQHIRREKATSNICTNQGLCATMVTIHLALIGKEGFTRLGELNMLRAGQVFEGLTSIAGVRPLCDAPFFNEFTVRLPIEAEQFCEWMREEGILPGLPATRLGFGEPNLLIVCATETKLDGDVKRCIETAKSILELQA
jgi:glycine dehydrogenase subunit 1